ncbi:hypothetical protein THAOC_09463, partial [Thalassiosira oceanica]
GRVHLRTELRQRCERETYKRSGTSGGVTHEFAVPIISGVRGSMHAILEQFPLFDQMAEGCNLDKEKKFAAMNECLSGNYKTIWQNVVAEDYETRENKMEDGAFNQARRKFITRTTKFEHPRDEHLHFLRHNKFSNYKMEPIAYGEEYAKHYRATKELEGTASMPNKTEFSKIFAESFPQGYLRYWLDSRQPYSQASLLAIARVMQTYYDREQEDTKESGDSDDETEDASKSEKQKSAKKQKTGGDEEPFDIDSYCKSSAFSRPTFSSQCRIHGRSHTWGDCNLNPRSSNYAFRGDNYDSQARGRGRGRSNNSYGQQQQGPGQPVSHHYQNGQPVYYQQVPSSHYLGAGPPPASGTEVVPGHPTLGFGRNAARHF